MLCFLFIRYVEPLLYIYIYVLFCFLKKKLTGYDLIFKDFFFFFKVGQIFLIFQYGLFL
jgi:hypothetical protein